MCISKVLAAKDPSDLTELRQLLSELNSHPELSVKISSMQKVLKMLTETQSNEKQSTVYDEI